MPDKAKLLIQHAKVDACALKTRGPRFHFPDTGRDVSLLIRVNRAGAWKSVPVKNSTALIEPPECTTHIDLLYRNTGAMIEFTPECR